MTDQTKGLLLTLFGVLFVVPDSLFVRLIDADPLTIAFWRLLIAGGGTAAWIFWRKGAQPFRAVLATGTPGIVYVLGLGSTGLLFVLAVSLTSVANVVLILASLPMFAALFGWALLGEPPSARLVKTMIVVALGLAIIAYGSGESDQAHWSGDILALCVSALFALALTMARRAKSVSMVPGMAMGYLGAAILLLPFADPFAVGAAQAPLIAAHGGFILASSVLLAQGPRYITSAEMGLLVLLETVLAPLLAWSVIGEHPGAYALTGGAVVVGALLLSNLIAMRRAKRKGV